MKTIEDFKVGDSAQFTHKITQADIQKFAEITGDDNPLHVDKKFADQTSFKGIVAHGMLSASFFSTLIGKHIPGDGALWIKQSLNFLLPVRPDDQLTVKAEVTKISLSQKTLTIYGSITNQYGQKVLDGEGVATLLETVVKKTITEKKELVPTVLITGASRGIGAATAQFLVQNKSRVIVNYSSDKTSAEELCHELNKNGTQALALKADVADASDVKTMISKSIREFGYITGLVNNACPKIIFQPFIDTPWEEFERHYDVQVKGMYNCVRELIPHFLDQKSGSVVTVSSTYVDAPPANFSSYATAKSAIVGLNKCLAVEYGPKGIRFNIVAPGTTDTKMISEVPEKMRLLLSMQNPMRRLAEPEDVASAVEFLLSDKSKYITGEIIRVCGGQVML